MQDKTRQLLQAMTTVQIENAVRQAVATGHMHEIAASWNAAGRTINQGIARGCLETGSQQAFGNAWYANNFRMRPNMNMLAAIGYAVNDMMSYDRPEVRAAMEEKAANHPRMN